MKKYLPLVLYLIYSLLIFLPTIVGSGIPMGGDWSLPYGSVQTAVHYEYFSHAWNELASNGSRNVALGFFPVVLFMKLLFSLGISTNLYTKLVLPIIFTVSGISLYSLLRYFKIRPFVSFVGGLIYITTPIFFNYSIMGWVYILFFISALLPLAAKHFLIGLNEKSFRHLIIATIIFSFASLQAQSVVIYPIVFLIIGLFSIKNISDVKYAFCAIVKMVPIYLLLTAYWLPGMLLIPDQSVSGSDIVNSSVSIGTGGNLVPINIIRLFGGLFNFQFETIINKNPLLIFSSFVLPFLVLCSLFLKKHRRETISFWVIGLIPLFMYFLNQNRELFSLIPYSNVFRDFSRFTVLSSFAYAVLAGITINSIIDNRHKFSKLLLTALSIVWLISLFPWWHSELTTWENGYGPDMRLRSYSVNQDYISSEKYLASLDSQYKALYLPTGGYISFPGDKKFFGPFNEMQDIFSQFSPIPGALVINDRNANDYFINNLRSNLTGDLVGVLGPANYKYIILRKDAYIPNQINIINNLDKNVDRGSLKVISENSSIKIYELTNPSARIYSRGETMPPLIDFRKNSPSKYSVKIEGAKEPFIIIFNEHYHPQWKVYVPEKNLFKKIFQKPILKKEDNVIANGFSNSWQIFPTKLCEQRDVCFFSPDGTYTIYLSIEFFPERVFHLGLLISTITLAACFVYIFKKKNEK